MHIDLYTLTWNDADMLPFFFRHYDGEVDRYIIYDDGSTDGTLTLLKAHPRVEVRRFVRGDSQSFVQSHRQMHESCWKESRGRADWVVVTAVDEHLHVRGTTLREYLGAQKRAGTTYIPALGFQMISEEFPQADERLCQTRTRGAPFWEMNKLSVFDPSAIEETQFAPGRHSATPVGRLRLPERDELLLLHYKYLDFERTVLRHAQLRSGLGPRDHANGHATQYGWARERLRRDWDAAARRAIDTSSSDLRPWETHRAARWWRSPAAWTAASLVRRIGHRVGVRLERYQ